MGVPILVLGHFDKNREDFLLSLKEGSYHFVEVQSIDEGFEAIGDNIDVVVFPTTTPKEMLWFSKCQHPLLLLLRKGDIDTLPLEIFKGEVELLFFPLIKDELFARIRVLRGGLRSIHKEHLPMQEGILHYLEDVVYSSSLHGEILYMNPSSQREYGEEMKETVTKRLGFLKNIIQETGYSLSEYRLMTKKGLRYLEEKTYLVKDKMGCPLRIDGIIYDITEQKHTENALRQGEARMRSMVTVIPDILIHFSQGGVFKEIWAQDLRQISLFPLYFLEKGVSEVLPRGIANLFLDHIEKAIKKREIQVFTYSIEDPVSCTFEVRIVASGKDEVLAILRDITDLRKAQEDLQRFRVALDSSGDIILLMDYKTGIILDVNKTATSKLCYGRKELLKMDLTHIQTSLSKEDRKAFFSLLKKGGKSHDLETFFQMKDKYSFPVEVSFQYVENSTRPLVIASARDIRSRINLQKERDRLFNLSLDMMCILDGEGVFHQINPAWRTTMGWREGDLVNSSFFDYLHAHDEKDVKERFKDLAEGLPVKNLEKRYRCKDGSYKWLSFSLFPVEGENMVVSVVHDITEGIEHQEQLKRYTQELELAKGNLELVQRRLKKNIAKAGELHKRFLPTSLPSVPELSIATYYHPAERIGGDFYNIISLGEDLMFYMADVSGHGLDGAMLTIFMRETINNYLTSYGKDKSFEPAQLLHHLTSKFLQEDFPWDYFITLYLFILDRTSWELVFSNAGSHIYPVLLDSRGSYKSLIIPGLPISRAIESNLYHFQNGSVPFSLGDTLFVTTDGLVEQDKGDGPYGTERILHLLQKYHHLDPQELVDVINHDFETFNSDLQGDDDISFFIVKRKKD